MVDAIGLEMLSGDADCQDPVLPDDFGTEDYRNRMREFFDKNPQLSPGPWTAEHIDRTNDHLVSLGRPRIGQQ